MRIELTAEATADDRAAVLSGLVAYNREWAEADAVPLAVLVRGDADAVIGGLIGRTFAAWLYVELLWLPESLRGTGLGAELLSRAEREAARRGCLGAHLNTFSFQAPGFYQRQGYEAFGTIEDSPPGHRRIFLRKRFPPPGA